MTRFALPFYAECCFTVMTGTARLALFHLLHGNLDLAPFGFIDIFMTISTGIYIRMKLVTKWNIPGIFVLEDQLFYRVAFGAVLYRECFFRVVAGAAGFTLFHGSHADPLVFMVWLIQGRMTLAAICNFHMLVMTEKGRPGLLDFIGNILDRMAGDTLIKTKGFFIIMAGTAGLALFHLLHGKSFVKASIID